MYNIFTNSKRSQKTIDGWNTDIFYNNRRRNLWVLYNHPKFRKFDTDLIKQYMYYSVWSYIKKEKIRDSNYFIIYVYNLNASSIITFYDYSTVICILTKKFNFRYYISKLEYKINLIVIELYL